jgi:hypothetical protein
LQNFDVKWKTISWDGSSSYMFQLLVSFFSYFFGGVLAERLLLTLLHHVFIFLFLDFCVCPLYSCKKRCVCVCVCSCKRLICLWIMQRDTFVCVCVLARDLYVFGLCKERHLCVCVFLQEICRESYKTCVNFFQSFFSFLECNKIQQLWWVGGWVGRDSHSPRLALGALFFFFWGGAKFRPLGDKKKWQCESFVFFFEKLLQSRHILRNMIQ